LTPPMVAWIRFRWFGLWLPLFLLWPLVLALWLLFLPFVMIGMVVTGRISRFWKVIQISLAAYEMVCATKGLRVEVHNDRTKFEIFLI